MSEDFGLGDDGPVSGTRVALYAVAVLALVGTLFYGMSTATNNDTAPNPPAKVTKPLTSDEIERLRVLIK